MQYLMKRKFVWLIFFVISGFFLSGCYTQLAKSHVKSDVEEYYVEEDGYYEEQGKEGEEEYEDSAEPYEHETVRQVYYHDVHYYGPPWWYDPFFDPFFYYPYSSRVSIHIGYYDPFFYDPFFYDPRIWCGSYRYFYGYYRGPVFGFGFVGFPHHYYSPVYGYYGGYYFPSHGHWVDGHSVPLKRRGFSRGGTSVTDNFGTLPSRVRDRNSTTSNNTDASIQKVDGKKIEAVSKGSTYRRTKKGEEYTSPPVAKDEDKLLENASRQRKSSSKNQNSGDKNSASDIKASGISKEKNNSGYDNSSREKKSQIKIEKSQWTRKAPPSKKVVSRTRTSNSKKYSTSSNNKQKSFSSRGSKSISKSSHSGGSRGGSSKSSGPGRSGNAKTVSRGRK